MVEYVLDRKISLHICDNVTFILNLDYAVLLYPILFQIVYSYGSSGREVEYQNRYPKDVSSIPTHDNSSFNFHRKNLRKHPENLRKPPENLRIIPKIAENYGYSTVFLQPTNRKHIPLYGQFGLAASDHMYGIQRPEF